MAATVVAAIRPVCGVVGRVRVRALSSSGWCATSHPYEYDLCIVGGGAAGIAAASRAWDLGQKVCLIDKQKYLGGAEVWNGALSSKSMWQLSRRMRQIRDHLKETGQTFDYDWTKVVNTTTEAEQAKSRLLESHVQAMHKKRLRQSLTNNGEAGYLNLFNGSAQFVSPHEVVIKNGRWYDGHVATSVGAPDIKLSSNYFLIATGSRPRPHPSLPVDNRRVVTSDEILKLPEFPKSLGILGAGVIGCEFATIFSNFGKTQVHILNEKKTRLFPFEDDDVSNFIAASMQRSGRMDIHNRIKVTNFQLQENGVDLTLNRWRGDLQGIDPSIPAQKLHVDTLLLAIGRIPNIDTLDLDKAGITINKKSGKVDVDEHGRSYNQKHVYFCGDANGKVGLVNVAVMEGRHAVETMCAHSSEDEATPINYSNVSSIMFLRPEITCVGMNETEARRQKIPYRVAHIGYDVMSRGIINRPWYAAEYLMHPSSQDMTGPLSKQRRESSGTSRLEYTGFIKMICKDDEQGTLLGMRAAGAECSGIVEAASMLIQENASVTRLEKVLHPHPSISEGVLECVRMLMGRPTIHAEVHASCWLRKWQPCANSQSKPNVHDVEVSIGLVPSYGFSQSGKDEYAADYTKKK